MLMSCENLLPQCVRLLRISAAIVFIGMLPALAHAQGAPADSFANKPQIVAAPPVPTVPVVPRGPVARDVPRADAPLISNAPSSPVPPAAANPAVQADQEEMDLRMRELAQRMATAQRGAATSAQGASQFADKSAATAGATKAALRSQEEQELTEARADQSNQQKLLVDDARPLAARRTGPPASQAAPKSDTGSGTLTVLTALGVVITLILLLRSGMRKVLGSSAAVSSSSVVQVLTRVAVAPRSHVVLLRVGGRILVVSDSPTGMRTLSQIEAPEEVADILTSVSSAKTTSATQGFRQMLTSMGSSYDAAAPVADDGADHDEFRIDRARDKVSGLLGRLRNLTGRGGGT